MNVRIHGDDFVTVYSIYTLERLSGRAIYTKDYGHIQVEENLLSGFMAALFGFSESELKDTGIENIDMGGMRWVYVDLKGLLFICACSKDEDPVMLKNQLELIASSFCERFVIKEDFSELNWNGNLKIFEPMDIIVDSLMESWQKAKLVADAAALMDLLDVFQSIITAFTKNVRLDTEYKELDLVGMAFDGDTGTWDMEMLSSVDPTDLRDRLERILTNFLVLVKDAVQNEEYYHMILHNSIYPIIKHEWSRIKEGKIEDFIINLLM